MRTALIYKKVFVLRSRIDISIIKKSTLHIRDYCVVVISVDIHDIPV